MSSYHGWTHRPKAQGGTDPIPTTATLMQITRFYRETDLTVPDDTLTTVPWPGTGTNNSWFSSDGFATAGNDADVHDPGLTTTDWMYQYAAGLFMVGYTLEWEAGNYVKRSYLQNAQDSGTGGTEPIFGLDYDGTDTPTVVRNVFADAMLAQDPLDTGAATFHSARDVWALDAAQSWRWRVRVRQTSGSDKVITKAKIAALWMGASPGF